MNKRSIFFVVLATMSFTVALNGCSEQKPASVTEDADQAAIDAYKEQEKQIELDTMNEMEGEELE